MIGFKRRNKIPKKTATQRRQKALKRAAKRKRVAALILTLMAMAYLIYQLYWFVRIPFTKIN